jgi:hypothetical protein
MLPLDAEPALEADDVKRAACAWDAMPMAAAMQVTRKVLSTVIEYSVAKI